MRWLLALCCTFSLALTSCGEPEDNAPCEDDGECLEQEVCVAEGVATQKICRLREGMPCVRPGQCQPGQTCSDGFCSRRG